MAKKIQKEKIDNVGIHSFSKKADIFFSIISGLLAFSCILPFIFVIIISITDEKSIVQYGYSFFPSKFGVDGFQFLAQFKDKILQALFISVFVTVVGTVTNVFVPGSVVKGATLTSGWENGAISGNQVLTDQPIVFAGSAPINSWFTQYGSRSINAVEALEYSSNTYMVQIALKMMGQPYTPNMTLQVDQVEPAMKKLRSTFAEYGLGTSTGIDLPNESTGFIPKEYTVGNYLTNAFGQFDNYTPMQLAQYAATVANDGKRVSPHVVEGIYDNNDQGGLGQLKKAIETKELNQVHISAEDMALIKQGFYQVANGTSGLTTGKTVGQGASVSISAKTGTAETTVDGGKQAINTNVVAYAPSNNPKIAVAVVFPHNTNLQATVSHSITRDIINLYNQKHPMN